MFIERRFVLSRFKNTFYLINILITLVLLCGCYDSTNSKDFDFNGITIGSSVDTLINTLGEPDRVDESKYSFKWYIYNGDYRNYIQVGVKDSMVRGIYTNADNWISKNGIKIGSTKDEVKEIYESVFIGGREHADEYFINRNNVVFFYDKHESETLTSILVLGGRLEYETYPVESDEIKKSYEKQLFDLANSIRVRNGLKPFEWDRRISDTARKHSVDMANEDYFDHNDKRGRTPFDRMSRDRIRYSLAGENLAAGQTDPIYAHEELMNSKDHRVNILGEFERLGTGVAFGGSYHIYYTQKFYTPRP